MFFPLPCPSVCPGAFPEFPGAVVPASAVAGLEWPGALPELPGALPAGLPWPVSGFAAAFVEPLDDVVVLAPVGLLVDLPCAAVDLPCAVDDVCAFVALPCAVVDLPCTAVDLPWTPADLPCAVVFTLPGFFVLACVCGGAVGHGPSVSPCLRCAGSALWLTVIVTNGFVVECVW